MPRSIVARAHESFPIWAIKHHPLRFIRPVPVGIRAAFPGDGPPERPLKGVKRASPHNVQEFLTEDLGEHVGQNATGAVVVLFHGRIDADDDRDVE